MLTMDVTELTLLLHCIGFRLDAIDYDEFHRWNKKASDCGGASANVSTTSTNTARSADAGQHYINVEISCSKSKIVSHLSYKINDSEIADADRISSSSSSHTTASDPTRFMACTCPKRESRSNLNSFWEVQRSGTFAHQRRSVNALLVRKLVYAFIYMFP